MSGQRSVRKTGGMKSRGTFLRVRNSVKGPQEDRAEDFFLLSREGRLGAAPALVELSVHAKERARTIGSAVVSRWLSHLEPRRRSPGILSRDTYRGKTSFSRVGGLFSSLIIPLLLVFLVSREDAGRVEVASGAFLREGRGVGGGGGGGDVVVDRWRSSSSTAVAVQLHTSLLRVALSRRLVNMVISPFGICRVLRALQSAAVADTLWQTRQLMDEQLVNLEIPFELLNPPGTEEGGNGGDDPVILTADRVYVSRRIEESPYFDSFWDVAENRLDVTIRGLDFTESPLAVAEALNRYVDHKTRGFVREIVRPLSIHPQMEVAALSAVHVKSPWEPFLFEDEEVREMFYAPPPHVRMPARFMIARRPDTEIEYFNGQAMKAVRLPLEDPRLALYLMMPLRLDTFEFRIDRSPPDIDDLIDEMYERWLDNRQRSAQQRGADDVDAPDRRADEVEGGGEEEAPPPPRGPSEASKVLVEVRVPAFAIHPAREKTDVIPVLRSLGVEDLFSSELADMPGFDATRHVPVNIFAHATGILVDRYGIGGGGRERAASPPGGREHEREGGNATPSRPAIRLEDYEKVERITFAHPLLFQVRYQPLNKKSQQRRQARDQVVLLMGHLHDAASSQHWHDFQR